jgi:hypothetical protein
MGFHAAPSATRHRLSYGRGVSFVPAGSARRAQVRGESTSTHSAGRWRSAFRPIGPRCRSATTTSGSRPGASRCRRRRPSNLRGLTASRRRPRARCGRQVVHRSPRVEVRPGAQPASRRTPSAQRAKEPWLRTTRPLRTQRRARHSRRRGRVHTRRDGAREGSAHWDRLEQRSGKQWVTVRGDSTSTPSAGQGTNNGRFANENGERGPASRALRSGCCRRARRRPRRGRW